MSKGLGLEENALVRRLGENPNFYSQANYYPPCPQPDLTMGLNEHADITGLTLLHQFNGVPDLQVKYDENWVAVDPLPGAFVIILADQIQVCTILWSWFKITLLEIRSWIDVVTVMVIVWTLINISYWVMGGTRVQFTEQLLTRCYHGCRWLCFTHRMMKHLLAPWRRWQMRSTLRSTETTGTRNICKNSIDNRGKRRGSRKLLCCNANLEVNMK